MIKYQLVCDLAHEFEGWFQTSAAFDVQNQAGLVSCPVCNSSTVRRALMTPNLASPKRRQTPSAANIPNTEAPNTGIHGAPASSSFDRVKASASGVAASRGVDKIGEAMAQLRQLQRKIKTESRDVGTEFAAEARKIHYGESVPESIYGQSSHEECEALADEGIDVVAMPWLPPEH
jgi:hypothetical protein